MDGADGHTAGSASGGTPGFLRARARAWASLGCAIAGVWASTQLGGGSAWWFGAALVGACAARASAARWWWVGACAAVLCLAGGWTALRLREPPDHRLDRLVADGSIVTVRGLVGSSPVRAARREDAGLVGFGRAESAWFTLGVRALGDGESRPASGLARVYGPVGLLGAVRPGDRVEVVGVFTHPGGATNWGEPDWAGLSNERGRAGWITVGDASLVRRLEGTTARVRAWGALVRWREAVRGRALCGLGIDEKDRDASVVAALVLGERDAGFEDVYRVFQRAGVAHVLAVSGFHLALLCGLAAVCVRAVGEHGRAETAAVLVVAAVMLVAVPVASPVLRAGVLVIALVLGDLMGRRWDRLAVLAWAALGLLAWRPSEAMALGYLLSVGVTALLLLMGEREKQGRWWLLERHRERTARKGVFGAGARGGRWAWTAFKVNTACWAVSTPVVIAAAGLFSPLAPLASLVIVPLSAVLLGVGWVQALLGVVWPRGAGATVGVVGALGGWMGGLASWFDGLPGSSVVVVGVGWVWGLLATAFVVGWLFAPGRRRVFAALIAVSAAYAAGMSASAGRVDGLRVDMLDVGDGTGVLIRSGGDAVLWDCGSLHRRVGGRVADAAHALGVRRIETAFLTHANLDHYNGLAEAAERLGLKWLVTPMALAESRAGAWGAARARLEALGVEVVGVSAGDELMVGSARCEVLWPPGDAVGERWLGNEGSLVARFVVATDAGERAVLMTGDAQAAAAAGLAARDAALAASVIEAPHHGSANEGGVAIARRSGASVVLQSSGPGRSGDALWAGVRERASWLSTAEHGAVWAWIRDDGRVETGSVRGGRGR